MVFATPDPVGIVFCGSCSKGLEPIGLRGAAHQMTGLPPPTATGRRERSVGAAGRAVGLHGGRCRALYEGAENAPDCCTGSRLFIAMPSKALAAVSVLRCRLKHGQPFLCCDAV